MKTVVIDNTTFNFKKKQVSFMNGNVDLDGLVNDILIETHGVKAFVESGIDFDNAIYSDGFLDAIEDGLVPTLELHKNTHKAGYIQDEYHHICINGDCYKMYFK